MTFSKANALPYDRKSFLSDVYISEDDYDTICALLKRKKNIILQGPPGTGKTYAAIRLAYSLMKVTDNSCVLNVQFHQNSAYEDYIVGFRPDKSGNFRPVLGTFAKFFYEAAKPEHKQEKFYLIIDEINRANISKVFGEMLMLIESEHRNEELSLPGLDGVLIKVPDNVYIIGMMNTADRGIALVDYALRRRFAFYTMMPALDNPKFIHDIESYGNDKLLRLVDAVRHLNKFIAEDDPTLGPGFCIGHSYFCFPKGVEPTDADVKAIVDYELVPLLREYWFDPTDKDTLEEQIGKLKESIA